MSAPRTGPSTTLTPLFPHRPHHSGSWVWGIAAGCVLLVGSGVLAVVSLVREDRICALVPCDPALAHVGVVALDHGGLRVETGPVTARTMTALEVRGPARSARAPGTVLWRVERVAHSEPGWDGSVVLGEVPPGFEEVSPPIQVPRSGGVAIEVESACLGAVATFDDVSALHRDVVNDEEGATWSVDRFRTEDRGFSTCSPPKLEDAVPGLLAAAGAFAAGLGILAFTNGTILDPGLALNRY